MTDPADHACAEIEAAFRTHPAVSEVKVRAHAGVAGESHYTCWVVARAEALAPPEQADHARVRKWGKVFDLMHGAPAADATALPQPAWTSSFTRKKFPPEEIDDWVEATVRVVRSLNPSRLLELGCGSGVLVARLAQACTQYVGTDLSALSLESLARYLGAVRPALSQVTLMERPANNLDGFADDAFDTVVVNSVVQYFPHEQYLREVLEGAVRVTRPGGAVLLGDVRSLPVLEPLATALELFRAADPLSIEQLEERVRRRVATVDELVLAPAYFAAFAKAHPKVSHVELLPKRGRWVNEFSAYRYEVVVHVGAPPAAVTTPSWVDWSPAWSLEAIAARLTERRDALALRGVANARVEADVAAWRALSSHACAELAGLRAMLAQRANEGLSPEDVALLAERLGRRVQQSVARGDAEGRFDVHFDALGAPPTPVAWEAPPAGPQCNEPSLNVRRQGLVGALLTHVQPLLARRLVPTSITVTDHLPR